MAQNTIYWKFDTDTLYIRGEDATGYTVWNIPSRYSAFGTPWYSNRGSVTSVVIETSIDVTSMANWFYYFINLTSFSLSDGASISNVTDMTSCFIGCESFNQLITIPSSVTYMYGCFQGCTSFNRPITIPSSVTNMDYCFKNCTSFNQPITIPSSVTYMTSCFQGCKAFNQPITVPSSVTNMGDCFQGCTVFNQPITIPNSVTSMPSCFEDCTSFNQPITIPSSVTDMSDCFYGCTALNTLIIIDSNGTYTDIFGYTLNDIFVSGTSTNISAIAGARSNVYQITKDKIYWKFDTGTLYIRAISTTGYSTWNIPSFYTSTGIPWYSNKASIITVSIETPLYVSSLYSWFYECGSLVTVFSNTIVGITGMYDMFYNCQALTTLDVSGWDTSSVTSMYNMFRNCQSLTSLDVSGWDTSKVTGMGMVSMFDNCQSLTSLDVSGWDTSKVTNMATMFQNCQALTTLDVSGWDTSSVTSMYYMFYNCKALTTLDVSGWDTSKVTAEGMYYMFYNCKALTTLDVSGWDTSSVNDMRHMFDNCQSLTSLDVSGWDTSSVENMNYMFYKCQSLTSLDVSGWDTSSVTDMIRMFYNCQALTTLDVSGWDTSSVASMYYMFYNCQALTSLVVSGWDTSWVIDMDGMFSGCQALTTLDVSGWDTSRVTDMDSMFSGCQALTTLDVSGWDTSRVTDMDSMFRGCQSLITLYFPKSSINVNVTASNMFADTAQNIYLLNAGTSTQSIIDFWKNIASQYVNVHYETDDVPIPTVSNYSVLRVGSSGSKVYSETGEYAYLKVTANIYSNYLPPNYVNSFKSVNLKVDNTSHTITWTTQDTDFPKVYEGWYNIGETGYKHLFEVSSSDTITLSSVEKATRTGVSLSFELPKSVVLIDYYHDSIRYEVVQVPDVADIATYYEYDSTTDTYSLTEDQSIVSGKLYYVKLGTGEEGMAIGKYASHSGLLDIGMNTSFDESVKRVDMTSQEVQDFIDDLNIGSNGGATLDTSQADWVVGQGTDGIWTWRKWSSGIAECWGTVQHTVIVDSQWGGVYGGRSHIRFTYPTNLFVDTPIITVTSSGSTIGYAGWVYSQDTGTATTSPQFNIVRGTSGGSDALTYNLYMQAKGRWK